VVETWVGIFLPAKAPADVVNALSAAIKEASRSPALIDNLAKFGSVPTFQTPDEFAATMKSELNRWGPIVKTSGFVAID
jgi:tripartite-type tricarboxylate transporter receptor subunit TctC